MVVVSVRPGATAYLRSSPSAASAADALSSGLPSGTCRVRLVTAYGTSSSRFGARLNESAPTSPKDDTYPLALRASSGHVAVSFSRPISRTTAKPRVFTSTLPERTSKNCILEYTVHPRHSSRNAYIQTLPHLATPLVP